MGNLKVIYNKEIKMYKVNINGLDIMGSTLEKLIESCLHAQKFYNLI